MKKKLNYIDIIKETVILTVAVAIIAAAVYFKNSGSRGICRRVSERFGDLYNGKWCSIWSCLYGEHLYIYGDAVA